MSVEIRKERAADVAAIRDVSKRAFGQEQEGNIIDASMANGALLLSLVAVLNDEIVARTSWNGHLRNTDISGYPAW